MTGEYDETIADRITQKGRPVGLFLEKDNSKVWVKTWSELIRDCESRLRFIQEKLRIEVSREEIEGRIAALKSSLQGTSTGEVIQFPSNEPEVAVS